MVVIKKKFKKIYVYLNGDIFFVQDVLTSSNKAVNNTTYTFFYVLKVLNRFGLVSPISKKFGYE